MWPYCDASQIAVEIGKKYEITYLQAGFRPNLSHVRKFHRISPDSRDASSSLLVICVTEGENYAGRRVLAFGQKVDRKAQDLRFSCQRTQIQVRYGFSSFNPPNDFPQDTSSHKRVISGCEKATCLICSVASNSFLPLQSRCNHRYKSIYIQDTETRPSTRRLSTSP